MQDVINSFTTAMPWLIMLMSAVAVVLLELRVLHLHQHCRRALTGAVGMALVVAAAGASLLLFAEHAPKIHDTLSQLLLPLVAPILIASLYHLSFPSSASHPSRRRRFLLTPPDEWSTHGCLRFGAARSVP